MKRDLKYYLSLNYKIEIAAIPIEDGGGFEASIPDLGKYAFIGYGKTVEEALGDLVEVKKGFFEEYLEKGIKIPEPTGKQNYRGEFLLRMPKVLHMELAETAEENAMSLNQYLNYLITRNYQLDAVSRVILKCFEMTWRRGWESSLPKTDFFSLTPGAEEEKLIGA